MDGIGAGGSSRPRSTARIVVAEMVETMLTVRHVDHDQSGLADPALVNDAIAVVEHDADRAPCGDRAGVAEVQRPVGWRRHPVLGATRGPGTRS